DAREPRVAPETSRLPDARQDDALTSFPKRERTTAMRPVAEPFPLVLGAVAPEIRSAPLAQALYVRAIVTIDPIVVSSLRRAEARRPSTGITRTAPRDRLPALPRLTPQP